MSVFTQTFKYLLSTRSSLGLTAACLLAGLPAGAQSLPVAPLPEQGVHEAVASTLTSAASSQAFPEIHAALQAGKLAEAEQRCRAALVIDPQSADAHYLLAYALFREEKAMASLRAYTAAAALRRPQASDLMAVGADYVVLGDYTHAVRWFTRVTEWMPGNALAWYDRGRAEYKLEQYTAAEQSLLHSLMLEPTNARTQDNLGLTYNMLGQTGKAKAAFTRATELESGDPTGYSLPFLNLGSLLLNEGDLAGATPLLQKAAALSPSNPKAHEQLATAYEQAGKNAMAEQELELAVSEAPESSPLHYLLGRLYRKDGKGREAEEQFKRTAELNARGVPSEVPDRIAADHK